MIPNGTRFIGIATSVDLKERRSAVLNKMTEPFTIEDIFEYVNNNITPIIQDFITVTTNYSSLPLPSDANDKFYWCEESQGVKYLPGTLGGTYYSAGMYYSNGVSWSFLEVPYQATQVEVDNGINSNKFVTPSTLLNSNQWNTKFNVPTGTSAQYIQGDGGLFNIYNNSVTTSKYFQNIALTPILIDEMQITPPFSGKYKIDFNTQFNTELANITQQSVVDLNALYLNLNSQTVTNPVFPTFVGGSIIFAGVYETAGAVGPIGPITLDGQGNPNAIFIFRTVAAFSTGAGNVFNLINGAKASNVFVVASGAITLGAGSNFSGTLLSPLAAIGVGAGAFLNGRVFSMAAAISTLGNITTPTDAGQFPMGILPNFAMFTSIGAVTNVGANIIIGDIGTNNGTVTGFQDATLSGFIYLPAQGASNVKVSFYVDNVIVPTSTRERTNSITKEDVVMSEVLNLTANQTVTVKVTNSIGISRFYNRILTIVKL